MNTLDRCILDLTMQFKLFLMSIVYDEEGDVNIVSIVVLIGIAVLLAVFFRKRIEKLLETLLDTIEGTAESAVSN